MKARDHCTSGVRPETTETSEMVSIRVDPNHPLLQLKRALPWDALCEVMRRHWQRAGKNIEGRPGVAWDVALYVPLVVLMLVQNLNARAMEAYLAENVVARVFIGRTDTPRAQIRDHANIARAYVALGKDGVDEVNALILACRQGLVALPTPVSYRRIPPRRSCPSGIPTNRASCGGWRNAVGAPWQN